MTKLVRLVMWRARLALVVVVNDGLWQIFKFNSRRPQRRLLNLKFCQRLALWMTTI